MTTATNESFLGWLLENCYLMEKEMKLWARFESNKGDFSDGGNYIYGGNWLMTYRVLNMHKGKSIIHT